MDPRKSIPANEPEKLPEVEIAMRNLQDVISQYSVLADELHNRLQSVMKQLNQDTNDKEQSEEFLVHESSSDTVKTIQAKTNALIRCNRILREIISRLEV